MNYEKFVAMRNATNRFAIYTGVTVESASEGKAVATMRPNEKFTNPIGVVHGGALYTLADVVAGVAASSFGYYSVTLNGEYQYLRAVRDVDIIKAVATTIKRGKNVSVVDVEVYAEETLVGTGRFNFYNLDEPIIVE